MDNKKAKLRYEYSTQSTFNSKNEQILLGHNTSRIYRNDPKLLLFTLSRYKFVSKCFSKLENVLEIGCQEAFGSQIVAKEVSQLDCVDFYKPYIDYCKSSKHLNENMFFYEHDIVASPVNTSKTYDGAFALDVLEHIDKENENIFINNIIKSLNKNAKCIFGMPSLESQIYASEESKRGHVNCMKGNELEDLMNNFFSSVLIFSMNDEVLHTGFRPMSHYLFALCQFPKVIK